MRLRKRHSAVLAAIVPIVGMAMFLPGRVATVHAFDPNKAPEIQDRLLDATADIELGYHSPVASGSPALKNYTPTAQSQCPETLGSNVKVNQNCLNISDPHFQGRSQAQNETSIAVNPRNGSQLVATSNDYRRGDGTCGVEWTTDGGAHWQDSTLPNGFVRGTAYGAAREYFQASGDPSVAWDSQGNAYYSCQQFERGTPTTNNGDFSSAVYLYRSTQNGGASWSFPGTPVIEQHDTTGAVLIDKPYMTVDNHVASPFRDRVYVSWTTFASDGTAYLYSAYSSDYGHTFSTPVLVSTNSALCANSFGLPTPNGACNENQFSDPFTGSDGNLYVVYANFNNSVGSASDNHNQMLLVKSTDGGATFSAPVLAGNYYDLPDCSTYQAGQDGGRACVPEQGSQQHSVFRATNYPSGAVNPTNAAQVVVTFGSYINGGDASTCTANGVSPSFGTNLYNGVKTSACSNKILVSVSSSGASSFANTDPTTLGTVNGASQAGSDQWWQWSAFTSSGKLAVSYYDRQYASDETTGSMDVSISLAKGDGQNALAFSQRRVTSSSMPVPTEFPDAQGNSVFFGDYTGLAAANDAHPLWMDTRGADLFDCGTPPSTCTATEPSGVQANDEDIFTARIES
jgi:hypothetical protein